MIEILSPAGNRECLQAAVRSGADAVYLGTEQFNARRNADNFSYQELSDAVDYCHARNVKVYLTLNTLIYNNELSDALNSAIECVRLGVDGIICADLGLATALKKAVPNTPIHASTQLSVHTKEALYTLKELGFSRVVPAREMSKGELEEFCSLAKELGIEVEVFIHGALCMCLSGQCLMSAHLGGRSGNRGLCAGTCRLPFSVGGNNRYALSLKDMCHIPYINELRDMGVTSFKIEGRMKPPEYVAAATACCRLQADNGEIDPELFSLLEQIFSRNGFTSGYYTADKTDMFGTRTDADLSVTRKAEGKLHGLYRNERQSVKLDFSFAAKSGMNASLKISDGEHSVEVTGPTPETANHKEIDKDFILSQLSKLGGTPYYMGQITTDIDCGLSLSSKSINSMRREAVDLIEQKRRKKREGTVLEYSPKYSPSFSDTTKVFAQFKSVKNIPKDLSGVFAVIIPLEEVANYSSPLPIIAEMPRGMKNTSDIVKHLKLAKGKVQAVICHNLAAIQLAKQFSINIIAGSGLNCLNPLSFDALMSLGAKKVTLSYEAKIADKKQFNLNDALIYVYGKTPLMLTDNCPISADVTCAKCQNKITDRKGVDFPVYCRGGYAEIYNSRPLWLADRLGEYSGFYGIILSFLNETEEQISDILSAYKNNDTAKGEYTRGLYDKGVL